MNKTFSSPEEAVADIADGSTIMFGGFGVSGIPFTLTRALYKKGTRNITMISNSPGGRLEDFDLSILFGKKQVKKVIATFPVYAGKVNIFEQQYLKGEVELEVLPQGTLLKGFGLVEPESLLSTLLLGWGRLLKKERKSGSLTVKNVCLN